MRPTTTAAQSGQNPYREQNAAISAVDYAGAAGRPSRCVLIDAHVGAGHAFPACAKRAAHRCHRHEQGQSHNASA
jgi:hypothetical protein